MGNDNAKKEIWLVRHGETEWSRSGAHTGRTDLPLTPAGRENAVALGRLLAGRQFGLVLCSPMQRARDTCRLAGFGDRALTEPNLREWDYGDFEGRTTPAIRQEIPDWSLWVSGVPNGETIDQVAARAEAVIARALAADTAVEGPGECNVALFAHGHILRILTARWLGFAAEAGRFFALGTASIGSLGYERETRVITRWNLSISA
ncbi:MAG TPA: histidine phosphatase family protein [Candidatus Acidoferrales bacterium]|nr:histidine phosphatase family protein [Candidatus Acidoferrales bacterium]